MHACRDHRVEQRLTGRDTPNTVDEVGRRAPLSARIRTAPAMIASNSASSSLNDVSIRHLRSGNMRAQVAADLDPVPSGSRTSRTATSGIVAGTRCKRFGGGSRLADDLEVVGALQQLSHTSADDLMVIEEEHPDHNWLACSTVSGSITEHASCAGA